MTSKQSSKPTSQSITKDSNQPDNSLYYVQITEPNTGKLRIFYLYDGILPEELNNLYQASFENNQIAKGFTDETGIIYPPSLLAINPKLFGGRKLYAINDKSFPAIAPNVAPPPTIGIDSQDTLLTEDQVRQAFEILDINADNMIHKEEFIEALSLALLNLFEIDPGVAFAYSCIGSKDLAIITATTCYHTVTAKDSYFLTYDDFCAWYMSAGFDPLRELMIRAIDVYSTHRLVQTEDDPIDAENNHHHHLIRTKSRTNLDLSSCNSDLKLLAFIHQLRECFSLTYSSLSQLIEAFSHAGKYSTLVSIRNSRSLIIDNVDYTQSAGILLNMIYDIIDDQKTGSIALAHLISLFIISSSDASSSALFERLFQYYTEQPINISSSPAKNPGETFVNDVILLNHLTIVVRLIFYFSREYHKVTGARADQLSHAIYLKLLISVEVQRKAWGKLSLSEFIELFIHGLHLILTILQIQEGYFYDILTAMLGYHPSTEKSILSLKKSGSRDLNGEADEDEEDDDEEDDDEENDDDYDDNADEEEEDEDAEEEEAAAIELLRSNTDDLEEDQITSFLVGYNGAAITTNEAYKLLGLNEYSTYDIVKYFIQLTNKDGLISLTNFNRGILKLIGDHYISLTVLQRSKVDFILDQMTKIFGLSSTPSSSSSSQYNIEEKFSLLDICIALLLFCDDENESDTFTRAEIILALIRPKAISFSIVYAVISNLYKACYALNPLKKIQQIESEANADAKVAVLEYYLTVVSPKINPLRSKQSQPQPPQPFPNEDEEDAEESNENKSFFTNTQFLKLLNVTFETLDKESEKRRIASNEELSQQIPSDGEDQNGESDGEIDEDKREGSLNAFSEDEESDGLHLFLDDDRFPPSSTVLELRAAVSVLGLEYYKADDLIDKLGNQCYIGGRLSAQGWSRWFAKVLQDAKISSFDMDLAIGLGNKIFATFQRENEDTINYIELAIGLAFLCLKSPLEERLMVAFTIADIDSDGFITFEEFVGLIRSTILIISVCSRLVTKKILALGTTIEELAQSAAYEGIGALGIQEQDEITLEMLCDLAEDYLKLAALV